MPLTRISSSTTITNSRRKATDRTGEWRRALLHSPGSDYTEREGDVMSVITGATKQVQVIRPQQRKHLRGNLVTALILGGPAFLLLLVFLIGPFFMGVAFSFTDERLVSPVPAQFIGAKNYSQMLQVSILTLDPVVDPTTNQPRHDAHGNLLYPALRTFTQDEQKYPQYFQLEQLFSVNLGNQRFVVLAHDPTFLHSIFNNIFFALVVVPVQSGLGLLLALLVNQKLKGRNFFRTIYFSPVVTSIVVISIVWTFLYDKNVGLVNHMLKTVSFGAIASELARESLHGHVGDHYHVGLARGRLADDPLSGRAARHTGAVVRGGQH